MKSMSDTQLMTRAAWLYYVGGLNQEATSKRMGLTRARVNRLLSQARATGLVSISINERDVGLLAEEEAIRTEFGLEFCQTTPKLGFSQAEAELGSSIAFRMVGATAAQYLRDCLAASPELIFGTGWGRTLETMSQNLSGIVAPNAKVFSLMGSLTSKSSFNPFEVVHAIAQATGAEGYFLPAPFIADSAEDRDVFISQRGISETMELAKRADLALVSVGELSENSLLRTQNMISANDVLELRALGAVGDTNGIFFDKFGNSVEHDVNRRSVATELSLLAGTKTVLLSAGFKKLEATQAILRSGAIKGLIIDGDSAVELRKLIASSK
jgi:DNA-binding transcriptional regulator LsrR (DeoR family)